MRQASKEISPPEKPGWEAGVQCAYEAREDFFNETESDEDAITSANGNCLEILSTKGLSFEFQVVMRMIRTGIVRL